ncbi:MAG TPA: cytochrome c family protein [Alphaproteobacteria bacterium]|nr:cytochrome c family protein [Alphaproteobacteria bacterium]
MSMELNKIFGGVLSAVLVVLLVGLFADLVFHDEELLEPAYVVVLPEEDAVEEEKVVEEESAVMLLASLDMDSLVKDGEKVAKKCAACHSFDNGGATKVGPNLWNVINAKIGQVDSYAYSDVLAGHHDAGDVWNFENMDGFLHKPKDWAPGTKMGFAGLKKTEDRAAIIAYLRSLSDEPAAPPAAQ